MTAQNEQPQQPYVNPNEIHLTVRPACFVPYVRFLLAGRYKGHIDSGYSFEPNAAGDVWIKRPQDSTEFNETLEELKKGIEDGQK